MGGAPMGSHAPSPNLHEEPHWRKRLLQWNATLILAALGPLSRLPQSPGHYVDATNHATKAPQEQSPHLVSWAARAAHAGEGLQAG